ncbi:TonB-dependent receptor [Pedobacter sp. HMF7647]|uniref:TonB-dependent receptor n=1 Tax=Hufsiella arboris TaxID=2695275 RepID=A0A7K1Y4K2_9SPHI|nr:outer membrane beta-barrel family protein [Hufsiella arboris]MXV49505.1 TonB-dependent receptor [Hufsiella arboris]
MNIAGSILAAGNSALEILSKAPGVTVDNDGNISFRGKTGVTVMLDGKLTHLSASQLKDLLSSTSGSAIQSIEIVANPSAKYDAEGSGGIINIKLKKNAAYGTNGSLLGGLGYGSYYKSEAGLTLNHRVRQLNIFGNYNYGNNELGENLTIDRSITSKNQVTFLDQDGNQVEHKINNTLKAGVDYNLSKKSIVGFTFNGYRNSNSFQTNIVTLVTNNQRQADTTIKGLNTSHGLFSNQTYNLNYSNVLDTAGQELVADLDYAKFHNTEETIYNNYFFDRESNSIQEPVIFKNRTPSDIKIYAGKLDYSYPINSNTKLETGVKSSLVLTDNDFQSEILEQNEWRNNAALSNHFKYKEQITAGYIALNEALKSTNLKLGLRVENTNSEGTSNTSSNSVKRNYIDFFPNVTINQILSKDHELGISFNRRIDRPDYQSLNPFLYYADLYTSVKGNPYLKPEYSNNFELSYGFKKTTNVTLNYSRTKDVITTTLLTDTVNKTLTLFDQNLASRDILSANINQPISIADWWKTNNDATIYYNRYKSPNLMGAPFENQKVTLILNSVQTFTLSPTVSTELSVNYTSAQAYGTYLAKPIYGVDLGVSKSFAKNRINLKMAGNDLFNQRIIKIKSAIPSQDYRLSQKQESRVFRLTATYNFGRTSVSAARDRSSGSLGEQQRVRNGN